jgi:hypothetical protein
MYFTQVFPTVVATNFIIGVNLKQDNSLFSETVSEKIAPYSRSKFPEIFYRVFRLNVI